jgi:hypothetical protein
MHVSKDSMWRRIYCFFAKYFGTKQALNICISTHCFWLTSCIFHFFSMEWAWGSTSPLLYVHNSPIQVTITSILETLSEQAKTKRISNSVHITRRAYVQTVVQHRAATGSQQRIRQQTKRNGSDFGRRSGVLGRFEDGGIALAGRRSRVPPAGLAPPPIPQQRPALDGLGVRVPLPAPPPTARRIDRLLYQSSQAAILDNNRTRAMHALELYVVTKQTRVHGTMDCCFT